MPPNVLFLMSDEHNHRFLGSREGGEPVHTPALDGLAERGTTFETTYCPYPICAPSRKCMLTGQTAPTCDAFGNGTVYAEDDYTLPEAMAEDGYETCLVGKMHFNGNRQFNGFEHRPYGDLTGHGIQQPSHQPDPIHHDDLDTQPRRQAIDLGTRIPNAGVTQIPESLLQEQVVARETIAWLREHRAERDEPWFLTASFSRPHFPLTAPRRHFARYWDPDADEPTERLTNPPVGYEEALNHSYAATLREFNKLDQFSDHELRRARAAYFACVDFLDEVINELLDTLRAAGFLEETIVVYASDHGDMAGEHGLFWKSTYHEGSTRVPWTVSLPEHRSGEREAASIETPVGLIDLFPTVCGLTGVDVPDSVEGMDLSAAVRTGEEPDRGPVVCDNISTNRLGAYRMVRDGRYKFVRFRKHPDLLFDLEADPHETTNLVPEAAAEDAPDVSVDGPTGDHADALERLGEFVEETIDFESLEERQAAAEAEAERRALSIPPGTGNAYLMPDGRLVDAATPLYKPDVLSVDPAGVFEDWPGRE